MDREEFFEFCREKVERILGNDYEVQLQKNDKLNGVIYNGIMISSDEFNISPTIYLDQLYEAYLSGEDPENIVDKIINSYVKNKPVKDFDVDMFKDFENVKNLICMKICNSDRNRALLEDIPHISFLDLDIIFYCYLKSKSQSSGQVLIRNNMVKIWNTSAEELYTIARKNTPRLLKSRLMSIYEVLNRYYKSDFDSGKADFDFEDMDDYMWVLTNEEERNGAVAILYKDVLKKFAAKTGKSFYILPSSIHETILLPIRKGNEEAKSDCPNVDDISELRNMVRTVNSQEIADEDFLSDEVYYYDRQEDRIVLLSA